MTTTTKATTKYILLQRTLFQGPVPYCWEVDEHDNDSIKVYDTEREAQLDLLDLYETMVTDQIAQFKDGDRDFDGCDLELDGWVEPVIVLADGSLRLLNEGVVWTQDDIKAMH